MNNTKIAILADSVYCATLLDENGRYYYTSSEYHKKIETDCGVQIYDLSSFGLTTEKAKNKFNGYLDNMTEDNKPDYFLIALGGNDCDRYWRAIAEDNTLEHAPKVIPSRYIENLTFFVQRIRDKNIVPVIASLAPIDAEKFWTLICKLADGTKILPWLKNVSKLYSWHEYYSHMAVNLAYNLGVELFDVREAFLAILESDLHVNDDGIHLKKVGYDLLFSELGKFFKDKKSAI